MGTAFLRVRSARAPYRRGGIEFGSLPLVLGREHFADGVDGLRQLVAIVTDPVLRVAVADADTPDKFEPVPDEMRAALVDAVRAVEVAEDKSTLNEAIGMIVAGLIGEGEAEDEPAEPPKRAELAGVGLLTGGGDFSADRRESVGDTKLQSPDGAEDEGDDAAAPEPDAEAKVDGGAASDEQTRAGADASEAAPAADADAGKQPEGTQQPPVAATELHNPMEAAAPAEATAKADAKPPRSSGRRSKARAADPAKG